MLGTLILLGVLFVLIAVPVLGTTDPLKISIAERLRPPSPQHFFGTDHYGRDIYSRVLFGSRISMGVAIVGSTMALLCGGIVGLVSGFVGGRLDMWLMRSTDVLLAFPSLLLAIGISAALGQGEVSIALALWLVYLPRFARLGRAAVIQIRSQEYVLAARAAGATGLRVSIRHIVPNILSPVLVQASVYFSEMILAEAALSYLGLGSAPPAPSWGNILNDGREYMMIAPWISIFPGLFILITVLGINLLGDGLRDLFDPRK